MPHANYLMFAGVFVVVAVCAVLLGKKTDMLRDSDPVDFGGAKAPNGAAYERPYSLAQTQMTWWFCIIVASFVYVALTKGDINQWQTILTEESLILLGIGTGTALGATIIEQTKASNAQTPSDQMTTLDKFNAVLVQIDALPPGSPVPATLIAQRNDLAAKLASENFFRDILTDVDGISLHRFQAVIWTVVIGGFFVYGVLTSTGFPTLGHTLLAVLGISGGTYLGFKIPEKPN